MENPTLLHESKSPKELRLEELEERLSKTRKAQALAEELRLTRARDTARRKKIDDLTRVAYEQARAAHGAEVVGDSVRAAQTNEEKNFYVLSYMMNEQRMLDAEINNPVAQNKLQSVRRMGRKALGVVGNWLSTGDKKTRIAKSIAVTGVASLALGVVGGGVAAAGGMAAVRYAKSYAKGRSQSVLAGMPAQTGDVGETHLRNMGADYTDIDHSFERVNELMNADRESHITEVQKQNLVAHKQAMGAVVIGAVVGTTIGSVIHEGLFESASAYAEDTIAPEIPLQDEISLTPGAVLEPETLSPLMPSTDGGTLFPSTFEFPETLTPDIPEDIEWDVLPKTIEETDVLTPELPTESAWDVSPGTVVPLETLTPDMPVDILEVDPVAPEATPGLITPGMPSGIESGITPSVTVETETITPEMPSAESDVTVVDGATESPELELVADPFKVESGHGYIHELVEAAKANDIDLSLDAAEDAHHALVDAHGPDYIELEDYDGDDTYSMGTSDYEVGISAPSEVATWSADAQPMIADLVDDGEINGSVEVPATAETEVVKLPDTGDSGAVEQFINGDTAYDELPVQDQAEVLAEQLSVAEDAYPLELTQDVIDARFEDIVNGREFEGALTGDDWAHFKSLLETSAANNSLNELSVTGSDLMHDLGPMLRDVVYPDGSSVVSHDLMGGWTLNDSDSPLPQKAFDTIYRYLSVHDGALKVQEFAKVL